MVVSTTLRVGLFRWLDLSRTILLRRGPRHGRVGVRTNVALAITGDVEPALCAEGDGGRGRARQGGDRTVREGRPGFHRGLRYQTAQRGG